METAVPRPAIRVEGLGKRFRLGAREAAYRTLRESLMDLLSKPFRRRPAGPAGDDTLWALRDVSFGIQPGEVVGVIGRNGAGKSTLLKILSRITPPTEGFAEIRGRVGSLLEVGTGFHPELTGRENVYLSGAILGMRREEIARRFDEIVAFAEVERFVDTPVKRYSSGMYLRLAFAVAAHLEPEILLVDEVLAVGDAAFQKKCLGRMRDDAMHGRTVLLVTHNMAAVSQMCARALWLDQGRLRMDDAAQKVVQAYLSEGAEERAERKWPDSSTAPGDERVRLRGCRVLQGRDPSATVDVNRETVIELDVDVLKPARNLVAGVSLYTVDGACLTASCDWSENDLPLGRYRKSVTIPPYTLAEGPISVLVQCVFFAPHIRSVVLPDALRFEAIDGPDRVAVRGPFKGAWPGLMRLRLPWQPFRATGEEARQDGAEGRGGPWGA